MDNKTTHKYATNITNNEKKLETPPITKHNNKNSSKYLQDKYATNTALTNTQKIK